MKNIFKNILLLLIVSLAGITTQASFAKTIKIATISPDGTQWMKLMREGAHEIQEKTGGRVKFKFYPGGVMGNEENVLRKIRIGQLQGGAIATGYLAGSTPDATIYGLPFIFSSLDEAEQVRKTTDPILMKLIEQNGFVSFGFAQAGFTYLMSKEKVTSFDDLRQRKSWVPENSAVGLSVYNHVGITPVTLPISDVLTGLQTGLIDTVITSPIGALALQWHSYVNYAVDLPLNYLTGTLVIDKEVFDKLSEPDQKIVREVMQNVYKKIDAQNKADNNEARQALINQGMKFIPLSEKEKAEWFSAGDAVIKDMIKAYNYNKDLYRAVMVHYRNAPQLGK